MRYTTHLVHGVLLVAALGTAGFAEETKAPWWHFGMGPDAPSAPAAVAPAPTMTPAMPVDAPIEKESWLPRPTLPKMNWPEFGSSDETSTIDPLSTSTPVTAETQPRQPTTHFGKPTHRSRPRNTWVQQPASTTTEATSSSPWKSVSEGTRTAWHKTVDFVTPGDGSDAPVVRSEPQESWWQRMWGPDEQKDEGPQTVTEWMAQDRLDP